jgi:hypothetical protein
MMACVVYPPTVPGDHYQDSTTLIRRLCIEGRKLVDNFVEGQGLDSRLVSIGVWGNAGFFLELDPP